MSSALRSAIRGFQGSGVLQRGETPIRAKLEPAVDGKFLFPKKAEVSENN